MTTKRIWSGDEKMAGNAAGRCAQRRRGSTANPIVTPGLNKPEMPER